MTEERQKAFEEQVEKLRVAFESENGSVVVLTDDGNNHPHMHYTGDPRTMSYLAQFFIWKVMKRTDAQ